MGYWQVNVGADHETIEIVPQRSADMHLNAVRMLETLCDNCLTIPYHFPLEPNVLVLSVKIRHPFKDMDQYTGFDVRGIFISSADYGFSTLNRQIAWGSDLPRLLTPEGYTTLYNPTEYPETLPVPPALKYIPGQMARGGGLTATLNPFMPFERDLERRIFKAWNYALPRKYLLRVPDGPFSFGYAVDANWYPVDGEIIDPVTDFPLSANCLEAYDVFPLQLERELLPGTNSSTRFGVEIMDHQGFDTIESVTIEAPDLFNGTIPLEFDTVTSNGSALYTGTFSNELLAGYGEYPLLIRVQDTESDQNLGQIDAWQVQNIGIKRGWARNWETEGRAGVSGVSIDNDQNIYVTGYSHGPVDLDPGPGITECGEDTISFLSKFNNLGTFQWGIVLDCAINDVVVDTNDYVNIAGSFKDTVDFDPGPGIDEHTSGVFYDPFFCRFDSNGNFIWVKVWGGIAEDTGDAIMLGPDDEIYITGTQRNKVDFDPGPGEDYHGSLWFDGTYLTKFEPDGEYAWARSWGSTDHQVTTWIEPVDLTVDSSGSAYVVGRYSGPNDFDPGPGVDEHISGYYSDIFLSKFDSSGNYEWVATWGGDYTHTGASGITVDTNDIPVLCGTFDGVVDFDPGPGVTEFDSSNGNAFISAFAPDGSLINAITFGNGGKVTPFDLVFDDSNNLYLAGCFRDTPDFDPGPGIDIQIPYFYGYTDAFLCKFNSLGEYQWSRTWGGPGRDKGVAIVESLGSVYLAGEFDELVDFDPGPGLDFHYETRRVNLELSYCNVFLAMYPPDGNWLP